MRTVWVYRMQLDARAAVGVQFAIPAGAVPVHTAMQHGEVAVWYDVPDDAAETEVRVLYLAGTGAEVRNPNDRHVGSLLVTGGSLVFHVYEMPPS